MAIAITRRRVLGLAAAAAAAGAMPALAAPEAVAANAAALYDDPDAPVGGNPDGDVTLVEFFDYRCGACKAVAPTITRLLAEDGNIRLVYKEWPIIGHFSRSAAEAALAADRLGRYVPLHEALMGHPGLPYPGKVMELAESVGVAPDVLKRTMAAEAPRIAAAIERNLDLARRLALPGTPAFVIGGEIVLGSKDLASLKRLVDDARRKTIG
ncbi:MAG: DsbA family protein [Rhodospirillales bacterium]|nr:DsbA family protein [Rhodospirillales bacterium]